ncbi:MAG: alpha/beta hydrolase [Lachnospiraceae bacterium]|nr:alpha/beta hydrolase [Lachnospiraceae bacterium]
MSRKIAVVFPGIGYHTDKPLLYFSKKLAIQHGYEIKDVPYGGFDKNIKGDSVKMYAAFESAVAQCEELLKNVNFDEYASILFISKSIGTAVAAAYGAKRGIQTRNIFFTPVQQSFQVMKDEGILFHGTADPWLNHEIFLRECGKTEYPYYLVEGGNHSLETGDALRDLDNLRWIMEKVEHYMVIDEDVADACCTD